MKFIEDEKREIIILSRNREEEDRARHSFVRARVQDLPQTPRGGEGRGNRFRTTSELDITAQSRGGPSPERTRNKKKCRVARTSSTYATTNVTRLTPSKANALLPLRTASTPATRVRPHRASSMGGPLRATRRASLGCLASTDQGDIGASASSSTCSVPAAAASSPTLAKTILAETRPSCARATLGSHGRRAVHARL